MLFKQEKSMQVLKGKDVQFSTEKDLLLSELRELEAMQAQLEAQREQAQLELRVLLNEKEEAATETMILKSELARAENDTTAAKKEAEEMAEQRYALQLQKVRAAADEKIRAMAIERTSSGRASRASSSMNLSVRVPVDTKDREHLFRREEVKLIGDPTGASNVYYQGIEIGSGSFSVVTAAKRYDAKNPDPRVQLMERELLRLRKKSIRMTTDDLTNMTSLEEAVCPFICKPGTPTYALKTARDGEAFQAEMKANLLLLERAKVQGVEMSPFVNAPVDVLPFTMTVVYPMMETDMHEFHKCAHSEYVAEKHVFTCDAKFVLVEQLSTAVNFLHSLALVHRDIKPKNIGLTVSNLEEFEKLIDSGGEMNVIKLFDFGLATDRHESGSGRGTMSYCAPESQAEGNKIIDLAKCDWFAVGIVAHELLTSDTIHGPINPFDPVDASGNFVNSESVVRCALAFFPFSYDVDTEDLMSTTHYLGERAEAVHPDWEALLCGLLNPDPLERFIFEDVINVIHAATPYPAPYVDFEEEAPVSPLPSASSRLHRLLSPRRL